ncbi:MAG TPA: hypothetical protein VK992_05295, partial [Candidatus Caenarcaniphilales bacterium]|nr:hypothetical protein [Candidatus Caenarcaniphilales bacterium]
MTKIRIVDVTDTVAFQLVPLCADARFDHRTCDYWEDADRGSKAYRGAWLHAAAPPQASPAVTDNPFAPVTHEPEENPFAPPTGAARPAGFADDELFAVPLDNPFARAAMPERPLRDGVPRKLALLDRGRAVFGSYAKVLLADGQAAGYCQFGPLSAYPRAMRQRDLYPQLPEAPLPAVITCIATTAEA